MAFVQEGKHQKSYTIAHFSAIALAYFPTLPRERQYICAIAAEHQGISLLSDAWYFFYIHILFGLCSPSAPGRYEPRMKCVVVVVGAQRNGRAVPTASLIHFQSLPITWAGVCSSYPSPVSSEGV